MSRRGRKRRLVVEDEYWRLIGSGVGTVEACRRVGIGRRTGYRWRAEHGGMPPTRLGRETSGRYLSWLERKRIATLRRMGLGMRATSRELGRSPSTASRELKRNVRPHHHDIYDAVLAHARAREKACRVKIPILARDSELERLGTGEAQTKVESKADRRLAPCHLPGAFRLAPLPQDHLPGPLSRP